MCLKFKEIAALQEKNREEVESKMNEISSKNKIIQAMIDTMDEMVDEHKAETDNNLSVKGAKLEKKIGEKLEDIQYQLKELKKNSAACLFSRKVQAVIIVALMFCRV
jgi:hypothetical protein